jgi:hypothetical protein
MLGLLLKKTYQHDMQHALLLPAVSESGRISDEAVIFIDVTRMLVAGGQGVHNPHA